MVRLTRQCRGVSGLLVLPAVCALALGISLPALAAQPVPLKDEMRMPWRRPPGPGAAFIRTWLVCGEFPNLPKEPAAPGREAPTTGLETDFLTERGGEAGITPTDGMTHARPDGSTAAWKQFTSSRDTVDFRQAFAGRPTENVVGYAFTTVNRESAGKAYIALGSDDGVRLWANGRLVHDHAIRRGVRPDEDLVEVPLKAGANRLLVKVEQGTGDWGFCLRVLGQAEAQLLVQDMLSPAIVAGEGGEAKALTVLTSRLPPALDATPPVVKVEVVAPGGRAVGSGQARRGERVTFETSGWPEGPYEVVCQMASADGRELTEYLSWYKGDALAAARALVSSAAQADPSAPAGMVHAMLAEMVSDKLGGKLDTASPTQLASIHGTLMEYAELAQEQAGGRGGVRPGGMVRLAYRDEVDGSPQFCRAYLPPDYAPEKKWPMIVSLHGYNPPNPPYVRWWGSDQRHDRWADRYHVIMLAPHGRGNTWYRGIGDRDVVRCIELTKQRFSVDEERVYLTGYSMGGGGTWHIGTRHPELFAAIAPYYGGWDYHVSLPEERLAKLTPAERLRLERESSFAQAEQLLNLPTWVMHGDSDPVVEVAQSRYPVRMLQRWGYDLRYQEVPGRAHEDLGTEDALYQWFLIHRRQANPRHVRLRAPELKSASAYWLKVTQRRDPSAFVHADAEVVSPTTIRLDTDNALEVVLSPGPSLVDPGKPVRVIWNGADVREVRLDKKGEAVLRARGYSADGLVKTPALEGPLSDFETTPFAIVMGTISQDPLMRRLCEQRAQNMARDWEQWQHWKPRLFKDTETSDEALRSYSLSLVGGPEDNLVTKRLIEKLPVRIAPDRITIGPPGFSVPDDAVGAFSVHDGVVRMIYPHPLNGERYVQLLAATSAAGMSFADRLPDWADFSISEGRLANPEGGRPEEKVLVAVGWFDHAWRLRGEYMTLGDPEVRAQLPVRKGPKHVSAALPGDRLMLSELLPAQTEGAFSLMVRDLNWQGEPIALGGKTYAGGICVNTWDGASGAEFDLSEGGWKRLRGLVGIELSAEDKVGQQQKDNTKVVFVVKGDGKELFRSQPFVWGSTTPEALDVDVSEVRLLRLEVLTTGSSFDAVYSADWVELRLER